MTITNAVRKNMIDAISGKLSYLAKTMQAHDVNIHADAKEQVSSAIRALFVDVYGVNDEEIPIVRDMLMCRALSWSKKDGGWKVSGSTFRSFVLHDVLEGFYGVDLAAYTAKKVKTVKDGDTIRPMTEEEIATWKANRIKKLMAELDKLAA